MSAPIVLYPNFSIGFVLKMDASYQGLGVVLSQQQEDNKLHGMAFASRALAYPEKNYAIT